MLSHSIKQFSLLTLTLLLVPALPAAEPKPLSVLFLGDNGHHAPRARFQQLQPVFQSRGITLTYTEKVADLNLENLNKYDGLMIFANHIDWKPENEKALLEYVASGKGFIPVHCASFCFTKSQAYIDLVGGQFRSHQTGVFRTTTVGNHEIMKGCDSFSSWDETYVHHKHNEKNRTVLETRTDRDLQEPWTWVRTEGKGRVFYTAWGHDQRTWSHSGFHALLERGTRWACGQSLEGASVYIDRPKMTPFAVDAKPFEFVPGRLPHYVGHHKEDKGGISTMQKPLSAAESLKHYTTPEGFEMKPFITEELYGAGKPIAMTWDERGRLWLALTIDYPNELKATGEGRDRIIICDDTDNDGVADKITTFADKLSIPTSLLRVHGGLVVHQAPNTLFLKDTDGDDKADVKQILFTGWNTNDTHAGPSNLRYGPDGWIYSMCGYSGFNGTVGGEKVKFSQGLFRFKIDKAEHGKLSVSKLEFLRSTSNNSWGVGFNEQGELFGSTANGCPLVHLAIPNRYYEKVKGLTPGVLQNIALDNHVEPVVMNYRQVDWHGGFTAAAACTPYTAGAYPTEYRNRVVFICEPTAHLVAAMVLEPVGTSYVARYGWNLCASRDDWAAPIDAQVGPDGNVWVIDWYNIIVQHNPTPQGYRTGKGNAYEIDLRDKKYGRIYRVVYSKAKPAEPVNLKGADAAKLNEVANHDNMFWRLQAQRLIAEAGPSGSSVKLKKNDTSLQSADLRVRLKTLLRLADDEPADNAGTLLAAALADPVNLGDPTLRDALTIAASIHAANTLTAISELPPEARAILIRVASHYASASDRAKLGAVLASLERAKSADTADAILSGLVAGLPANAKLAEFNAEETKSVIALMARMQGASRTRLLRLANAAGMPGMDAALGTILKDALAAVADAKQSDDARLDFAKQILEYQPNSDEAANHLITVAAAASPKLAAGIFDTLAVSKSKNLGPALIAKLKDLPPTVRPAAMRVILSRPESTKTFLDAVEKGELRFDVLALEQKTALAMHPDKSIRDRAKKILSLGGGLPDADRQKVLDQFMPIVKKTGDAGLGKKAFTTHCAKCHKHGNEGLTIGPDLTGFAVHPKEEILIHLLDPSRSVEGNFKQYTATLSDGRVLMGLLASESKTTVELLDAENKKHALSRDDIESLKESTKSIMPEGFEKQMKEEELVNLLEFLTQKGKFVPIPLDKAATIVSTKGMFYDEAVEAERLILKDWNPREINGVPFTFVDPQGDKRKNVILLHADNGTLPPTMPKSVMLPCNTPAKAIHFLSGVSGWGATSGAENGTVTMIVRFHYDDGNTEDRELKNGLHFADYIRRVEVKGSTHALEMQGKQQMRYLSVSPGRKNSITSIELVKGSNRTAPIVMAVTIETP